MVGKTITYLTIDRMSGDVVSEGELTIEKDHYGDPKQCFVLCSKPYLACLGLSEYYGYGMRYEPAKNPNYFEFVLVFLLESLT